ncbi:MAG: MBL fold metallo-hydrolase [Chloroflexota bacterium]
MSAISEVAPGIYMMDDGLYAMPGFGSVYLLNEAKKALVESGPAVSAGAVLAGIREIGLRPDEIDYIIVTHVHLDHAGGAGTLAREMPRATVVAHHRGAKHLIDPSRLVNSSTETRGKESVAHYGEVLPIAADRVHGVHDGERLRLGDGQELEFIDAPGHAFHELCIHESRNGGIFTGDAAGIYLVDGAVLLPTHPPPSFNLEAAVSTLERLIARQPSRIYFSHFGMGEPGEAVLQRAKSQLLAWAGVAAEAIKADSIEAAVASMVDRLRPELAPIRDKTLLYRYMSGQSLPLTARGLLKYYQEKRAADKS